MTKEELIFQAQNRLNDVARFGDKNPTISQLMAHGMYDFGLWCFEIGKLSKEDEKFMLDVK
jgi:hypothetical protein